MARDNVASDKSFAFAVRIVQACRWINETYKEYTLSKQLLRCGTSIGANLSEANGAISEADFSAKISIAYKECRETKYWLALFRETDILPIAHYDSLFEDADELGRILYSILKTTNRIQKKQ
jgi:four helix bundle protein